MFSFDIHWTSKGFMPWSFFIFINFGDFFTVNFIRPNCLWTCKILWRLKKRVLERSKVWWVFFIWSSSFQVSLPLMMLISTVFGIRSAFLIFISILDCPTFVRIGSIWIGVDWFGIFLFLVSGCVVLQGTSLEISQKLIFMQGNDLALRMHKEDLNRNE